MADGYPELDDVRGMVDRVIPLLGIVWTCDGADEMVPLVEGILGREMTEVDQAIVMTAFVARWSFNMAVVDGTSAVEAMRKFAALVALGEPI